MLPPQGSDVVDFLLLLSVDPLNHLTFSLLQQSKQVVKRLAHLRLLSASIFLKGKPGVQLVESLGVSSLVPECHSLT